MATELMTAYISLVPSLRDAQKNIARELGAVDVDGAGKKMGSKLSKSVTGELKKSLAGLRTVIPSALTAGSQAAAGAMDAAAKAVSAAELDLTGTRKASQTAAERVQVAEAKLTELRESGTASTKKIESAEARLVKVQESAALASQRVSASQDVLTQARRSSVAEMANHSDALAREGSFTGRLALALPALGKQLGVVGQSFRDVGASITEAGKNVTTKFTLPAVAAAGAIGAIFIGKGFSRLVGIDTARAQLKALSHDADSIESIMQSALDSVKGTAFGLGDAAQVAATAVAANVKPGKELTKYLGMVGDAAAIANIDLSEMGSILNQVQTGQIAYTDSLNMLADRGLPIFQWIADEAGVASSEVKKMASEGEISSELFFAAIQNNIGGAAKVIGENSFMGALDNVWAAVGRVGAAFLDAGGQGGGFFSQLKPLMGEFTAMLDEMAPLAAEFGVRFGEAFAEFIRVTREAIEVWKGLPGPVQTAALAVAGVVVASGPLLLVAGAMASSIGSIISLAGSLSAGSVKVGDFFGRFASGFASVGAANSAFSGLAGTLGGTLKSALTGVGTAFTTLGKAMFTNPIGIVITSIAALVGLLTVFFTQTETGKAAWASFMTFMQNALAQVGPIFESVMGAVMPVLEQVGSAIMTGLGAAAQAIMPILIELGAVFQSAFSDAMTTLLPVLQESAATLGPVFMDLFTVLGQLGATLASTLLPVFGELIAVVAPLIAQLVGELLPVVAELAVVIVGLAGQILTALVPVFSMVVQVVGELLAALLPVVAELVSALVPVILTVVGVVAQLIAAILPLIATILSILIPIITQIIAAIVPIITLLVGLLIPVIQALLPIITTVFTAVAAIISSVMTIIQGIIMTVTALISGNWAGVWDGIKMVFSGIWGLIVGVVMGAINIVMSVITGTIAVIKSIWDSVWASIGAFVTGVWIGIVAGVTGFVREVQFKIDQAMAFIGSIPQRIGDFFSGIGEWLIESGKSLIQGFLDGITAGFEGAKGFVEDGLAGIRDLFPFSPAKEGPFSGRGWVAYSGLSVGETFGQSVASALNSEKSGVVSALGGIQSEFDSFDGSATASLGVDRFGDVAFARNAQRASYDFAAGEAQFGSAGAGDTFNIYPRESQDEETIARKVSAEQEWKRRAGVAA